MRKPAFRTLGLAVRMKMRSYIVYQQQKGKAGKKAYDSRKNA